MMASVRSSIEPTGRAPIHMSGMRMGATAIVSRYMTTARNHTTHAHAAGAHGGDSSFGLFGLGLFLSPEDFSRRANEVVEKCAQLRRQVRRSISIDAHLKMK
jgi:hypothetical protein